jgi:penicillin-binding protein A
VGAGRGGRYRRRRRFVTRAVPIGVVAIGALAAGIFVGTSPGRAERKVVNQFVQAWQRGDYRRMYDLLDDNSKSKLSEKKFVSAYKRAADTATLVAVTPVKVGSRRNNAFPVRMRVRTRLFGDLSQTMAIPVTGSGSSVAVKYSTALTFPGLRPGEKLKHRVHLPPRAALLASNGTPLAEGPDRTTPIPDVAQQIAGSIGKIPTAEVNKYVKAGYPRDAKVGLDGMEEIFQDQLAGTPGGTLLAGHRKLASARAVPGHDIHTTINPSIERAAIAAEAGRYAGIVAMDPRTGAILGVAGVGFSALQPPGSTMKIITTTGALEANVAKPTSTYAAAGSANIGGYTLHNAGGEVCGGTLVNAFAVSCNSVFAPLAVKLGAKKFVAMAEKFGFNEQPSISTAAKSSMPSAKRMGGDVALGSSGIGQDRVQASALEMTDVAATIAMRGKRPLPTLQADQPPHFVHVTSRRVAGQVEKMMVAVVQYGTGTPAQIPGVQVAGKTGTAELRDTNSPGAGSPQNTDSWFVGFAPAGKPKIVVGALFPAQGAGAQTAAPAVQQVLQAGLH